MNTQTLRVTCPYCLAPVDVEVHITASDVEVFSDGSAELTLDISPQFDHSCPSPPKVYPYDLEALASARLAS